MILHQDGKNRGDQLPKDEWLMMAKSGYMVLQEQQLIIPLHNFIMVLYDSF
jgi:hypothetical protein